MGFLLHDPALVLTLMMISALGSLITIILIVQDFILLQRVKSGLKNQLLQIPGRDILVSGTVISPNMHTSPVFPIDVACAVWAINKQGKNKFGKTYEFGQTGTGFQIQTQDHRTCDILIEHKNFVKAHFLSIQRKLATTSRFQLGGAIYNENVAENVFRFAEKVGMTTHFLFKKHHFLYAEYAFFSEKTYTILGILGPGQAVASTWLSKMIISNLSPEKIVPKIKKRLIIANGFLALFVAIIFLLNHYSEKGFF